MFMNFMTKGDVPLDCALRVFFILRMHFIHLFLVIYLHLRQAELETPRVSLRSPFLWASKLLSPWSQIRTQSSAGPATLC